MRAPTESGETRLTLVALTPKDSRLFSPGSAEPGGASQNTADGLPNREAAGAEADPPNTGTS